MNEFETWNERATARVTQHSVGELEVCLPTKMKHDIATNPGLGVQGTDCMEHR
jgi:hypothetical protein